MPDRCDPVAHGVAFHAKRVERSVVIADEPNVIGSAHNVDRDVSYRCFEDSLQEIGRSNGGGHHAAIREVRVRAPSDIRRAEGSP